MSHNDRSTNLYIICSVYNPSSAFNCKSVMKNKTTINSTLSDKLSAIVHSAEFADIRCRIVILSMALGALPQTTIKQNFLLDTK